MQILLKSASWFMRYCAHKHLLAQIWQFKSRTDLEKLVKVIKIKSALHHVPMLYPCKSGWNLPTSSWDMVQKSTSGLKFGSLKFKWQRSLFLFLHCSFKGIISRIIVKKTACKHSIQSLRYSDLNLSSFDLLSKQFSNSWWILMRLLWCHSGHLIFLKII